MLPQPVCNEVPVAKVVWLLVAKKGETVECIGPVYPREFLHHFLEIKCFKVFQELCGIELGVTVISFSTILHNRVIYYQ